MWWSPIIWDGERVLLVVYLDKEPFMQIFGDSYRRKSSSIGVESWQEECSSIRTILRHTYPEMWIPTWWRPTLFTWSGSLWLLLLNVAQWSEIDRYQWFSSLFLGFFVSILVAGWCFVCVGFLCVYFSFLLLFFLLLLFVFLLLFFVCVLLFFWGVVDLTISDIIVNKNVLSPSLNNSLINAFWCYCNNLVVPIVFGFETTSGQ